MKGLFIIYAPALEHEVLDILKSAGQAKYTKFPDLHGVGGHSEPHLDTQVWPGTNVGLLVWTEEAKAAQIVAALKPLKQEYLDEGLKIFALPLEELL
jgi:hypothetical protein